MNAAYADIIRDRGGALPPVKDAYYSKLTYQEQQIANWVAWRKGTRRIIGDSDYTKLFEDIVKWRGI